MYYLHEVKYDHAKETYNQEESANRHYAPTLSMSMPA